MTEVIRNGDYVLGEPGLEETDYLDEVLQNALIAVNTKRGSFYPDKAYGCYKEGVPDSAVYALACARQALWKTDGVFVKSALKEGGKYVFTLIINNEERRAETAA